MRRQKDLLIVRAGIAFWLDVDEPELAGVSAAAQIRHGHHVRMNESRTSGLRS